MIKKRLVDLLSHAKKYIVYQVAWQWLSLLCQIVMIYCAAMLLEQALFREVRRAGHGAPLCLRPGSVPGVLPRVRRCEADPEG